MNTTFSRGFQPNSNKRIHHHFKTNADNPFTSLSQSEPDSYYAVLSSVFTIKTMHCPQHQVYALLHLLDITQNVWRILEVLHYLLKNKPKFWTEMINQLSDKKFHRGIHNTETGQRKIYNFCDSVLSCLLCCMVDHLNKPFVISDYNVQWSDISLKLIRIVNLLTIDTTCTCNQNPYPDKLLDCIKSNYPKVIRSNLASLLNKVEIDWHKRVYDYQEEKVKGNFITKLNLLLQNPPEQAISRKINLIPLSYDFLSESSRIDFIRHYDTRSSRLYNSSKNDVTHLGEYYMLGVDEFLPSLYKVSFPKNQCFVCDTLLMDEFYPIVCSNKGMVEHPIYTMPQFTYPITHRCIKCKKGKYGPPIDSNQTCLLARHYKWMTFYAGFKEKQCLLSMLPIDVAKVIILEYLRIR